jgi:hypothetical protein
MAWNTDHTRFKSAALANLDCGSYLKIPYGEGIKRVVGVYDGDLEVGQCVAMVRVPANAYVVDARLSWAGGTLNNVLAVGDGYACGRFLGPILAQFDSNLLTQGAANNGFDCGVMTKVGRIGDGCGRMYQYTCETDVVVTNLYREGYASAGGWAGSTALTGSSIIGAKWTGGRIVLSLDLLIP